MYSLSVSRSDVCVLRAGGDYIAVGNIVLVSARHVPPARPEWFVAIFAHPIKVLES